MSWYVQTPNPCGLSELENEAAIMNYELRSIADPAPAWVGNLFRVFRVNPCQKGELTGQKGAVEGARCGFRACHLYTFGGARGVSGACVMTDGEAENAFLKKRDFFFHV